jgi:hypothetical protein
MDQQNDTGSRRNIAPEFFDAVKRGLRSAGSKQDPAAFAKVLWTNARIAYRLPYAREVTTNENPHCQGRAVECIESTISRMVSK